MYNLAIARMEPGYATAGHYFLWTSAITVIAMSVFEWLIPMPVKTAVTVVAVEGDARLLNCLGELLLWCEQNWYISLQEPLRKAIRLSLPSVQSVVLHNLGRESSKSLRSRLFRPFADPALTLEVIRNCSPIFCLADIARIDAIAKADDSGTPPELIAEAKKFMATWSTVSQE